MDKLLAGSVFWRVCTAVAAWLAALGQSCVLFRTLGRWWRGSAICTWFCRRLGAEPRPTAESGTTLALNRLNIRLAQRHNLKTAWPYSVLGRAYGAVMRCGRESRLFGWLFAGGAESLLLFALGIYVLIDYLLRSVLSVPLLSSVWDELLMLFALFWLVWQRMDRVSPLRARVNPLDLPVCIFLCTGFVLMNVVSPYFSIQINGYRATVQYLLWFFLLTRILRDTRDVLQLYLVLIAVAFVLALHGIYQYIAGVPMPASWVAAAETAVRTRVYSIFGSPNIMGDYMVIFAPMAVGLAYYSDKKSVRALAWAAALCMCVACLFTMSRGAWIAMAVAIALFIVLVDRRLIWLVLLGGACLTLVPFVRTRIAFLFTDEFIAANTNGGRGERWVFGMELLRKNSPMLGVGLGMFGGAVAMQNRVLDWIQYFYMDNYYMKILVEMGYVGVAAFALMLVCWLHTCCRALFRTRTKGAPMTGRVYPLCAGMFSGLAGVLVHCYFENIFEQPYMMVYFWVITAMIVWLGFLRAPERAAHGRR